MTRLLRIELAERHIAACEAADGSPTPPIATVYTSLGSSSAVVRVEIHDRITDKVVSRDVSLASVPPDTRMLTLALSADELLRASWAELVLQNAPPPPKAPPAEVLAAVRPPPRSRASPRFALGAAAAIDAFFGASTLLGADVVASVWIVPRVRIEARFGARVGLAQSGPDGDVATSTLGGKLGCAVTLTPPERILGLDVAARVGFIRASFVPTPHPSATGTPASDVAVVADATLEGWVRLTPALRLVLLAGPTGVLRAVRITDSGVPIGGIDGAGITGALALTGTF